MEGNNSSSRTQDSVESRKAEEMAYSLESFGTISKDIRTLIGSKEGSPIAYDGHLYTTVMPLPKEQASGFRFKEIITVYGIRSWDRFVFGPNNVMSQIEGNTLRIPAHIKVEIAPSDVAKDDQQKSVIIPLNQLVEEKCEKKKRSSRKKTSVEEDQGEKDLSDGKGKKEKKKRSSRKKPCVDDNEREKEGEIKKAATRKRPKKLTEEENKEGEAQGAPQGTLTDDSVPKKKQRTKNLAMEEKSDSNGTIKHSVVPVRTISKRNGKPNVTSETRSVTHPVISAIMYGHPLNQCAFPNPQSQPMPSGTTRSQPIPQGISHVHPMVHSTPQGHSMTQSTPQGHSMAQQTPQGHSMAQSAPQGHSMAQQTPRGQPTPQGHPMAQPTPQGHPTAQTAPQSRPTAQPTPAGAPEGRPIAQLTPLARPTAQSIPQNHPSSYKAPDPSITSLNLETSSEVYLPDGSRLQLPSGTKIKIFGTLQNSLPLPSNTPKPSNPAPVAQGPCINKISSSTSIQNSEVPTNLVNSLEKRRNLSAPKLAKLSGSNREVSGNFDIVEGKNHMIKGNVNILTGEGTIVVGHVGTLIGSNHTVYGSVDSDKGIDTSIIPM